MATACFKPEHLTHIIWNRFNECKQDEDQFQKKKMLKRELEKMLRVEHNYFVTIYLFGSTVNKLGLKDADMDLCVVTNENPNQKESEKLTIKKLQKILDIYLRPRFSEIVLKTTKKVPIIKSFGCRFMNYTFDIDVNINFINSYRMSHLFWYYSQIDNRFCAMVVYLKILVDEKSEQEIINIPSSSIALLVLHFLQCGIKPRVLPDLQRDKSDVFGRNKPVDELTFTLNLKEGGKKKNVDFVAHENTSVGTLMLMLCRYYIEDTTFDDLKKITYPYGTANVAESISRTGYAQLLNLFKVCLDKYSNKQ